MVVPPTIPSQIIINRETKLTSYRGTAFTAKPTVNQPFTEVTRVLGKLNLTLLFLVYHKGQPTETFDHESPPPCLASTRM